MKFLFSATTSEALLDLMQPIPENNNPLVNLLGYAIAFAIAAGIILFFYKVYYKKDHNDPKDKLGKF